MQKKILTFVFTVSLIGVFGAIAYSAKKVYQSRANNNDGKKSIAEMTLEKTDKSVQEEAQEKIAQVPEVLENVEPKAETPQKSEIQKPSSTQQVQTEEGSSVKKVSNGNLNIVDRKISWGFQQAQNRKISAIILHSSYDAIGKNPYDVDGILAEYKQYGVSAHYLIDRDGTIFRLVDDEDIAYHAGVSKLPNGETNVNAVSFGIEVMTTQTDKFTDQQYDAVNKLIESLKAKNDIKYVLGHDQIAPGRKTDPWNIDWSRIDK